MGSENSKPLWHFICLNDYGDKALMRTGDKGKVWGKRFFSTRTVNTIQVSMVQDNLIESK